MGGMKGSNGESHMEKKIKNEMETGNILQY